MSEVVHVQIVTFNHEPTIAGCLESVLAQTGFVLGSTLKITLIDNASGDRTLDAVQRFQNEVEIISQSQNAGFTGAHNAGVIRALTAGADFIFILNPDVRLEPNALRILVDQLRADPRAGTACPKLYRADEKLQPIEPRCFDSAGMRMTPEIRHFDRASNERDLKQFDRPEYVFGASGAAVLLRREFAKDVSFPADATYPEPQLFDPLFFAYREDAELAWRGQWLGWKCRYVPNSIAYHQRRVLPENRSDLEPELNAYSVRNRFLMQVNNFSLLTAGICGVSFAALRNLLVVVGVFVRERSSGPALASALALLPVALRRRHWIRKHRRVHPAELSKWFARESYSEPALPAASFASSICSLTVIVVNFNSGVRLGNCLKQLHTLIRGSIPFQLALVDNHSSDDSLMRVRGLLEELPYVRIIEPGKNLGFAAAINLAAQTCPADAYLVLNPDIQIGETEVDRLIQGLNDHPDLSAVAPVLVDEKQTPQWDYTLRNLPTMGSTLAELFLLHRAWRNNPWTRQYQPRRNLFLRRAVLGRTSLRNRPFESTTQPLLIQQPAAACFLIRREAFDALNGFDEDFYPAWFEDVDFCKRLNESKRLTGVLPAVKVVHEGGYSAEQLGKPRFASIYYPNLLNYWSKHGTNANYVLLRTLLPFALLLRSVIALAGAAFGKDKNADGKYSASLFRLAFTIRKPATRSVSSCAGTGILKKS